jgi:putative peptide zinc metalloprotease protein
MSETVTTEGLRLRRDLICQKLEMAPRAMWVLKDPFSKELHYVSEDEFTILKLLNGKRSLKEILTECSRHFATRFVAPDALIRFLADAKRRHLLVTKVSMDMTASTVAANSKPARRSRSGWSRLLAWQLPGIKCNRWLDSVFSYVSPRSIQTAAGIYLAVAVSAALIAVAYLPIIVTNIAEAFASRGSEALIQFFIVIAVAKIIHELAHAFTCRYFGGDCREMGVMLLMGMPCLYCDVSDAWLMPQRYKRVLVSAAGMLAEIGLASAATLVWFFAEDAMLSQWCLVVMTVCSCSTVLVNGNPLMRYDGYFILSDLVSIPNLGQKATQSLRLLVQSWMGREVAPLRAFEDSPPPRWLPAYAMASLLYRAMVFLSLAWFLYQLTAGHHVAAIGIFLGIGLLTATLVPELKSIFAPSHRSFSAFTSTDRKSVWMWCIGVLGLLLLLIPLPRTLVVPMQIQAAESQTIFAGAQGSLQTHVREGDVVSDGDLIATIVQQDLATALVEAESELALLATMRVNLEGIRQSKPELSASLLEAKKAEDAAIERVALIESESSRLSIRSTVAGVVFAEKIAVVKLPHETTEPAFQYSLLDECNQGVLVQPGEPICTIGSKTRREAILLVEQKQASLVHPGQDVRLILAADTHAQVGKVIEVSASPQRDKNSLQPSRVTQSLIKAEHSMYQVRVLLEDYPYPLPVRTTGQARISVEPVSLAARLFRFFLQSIRI